MTSQFIFSTSYVVFALLIDLIVSNNDKLSSLFSSNSSGFDWRKFLLWLVIPMFLSNLLRYPRKIEHSLKKFKRVDWVLIFSIGIISSMAMLIIPHFEVLDQYYVSRHEVSFQQKMEFVQFQIMWTISWVFGYEYLIRFFWLSSFEQKHLNKALLLIPIVEVLYHYNKPWPEILGVLALSYFLIWWTIKRQNILQAILAHLLIEIVLTTYLIL